MFGLPSRDQGSLAHLCIPSLTFRGKTLNPTNLRPTSVVSCPHGRSKAAPATLFTRRTRLHTERLTSLHSLISTTASKTDRAIAASVQHYNPSTSLHPHKKSHLSAVQPNARSAKRIHDRGRLSAGHASSCIYAQAPKFAAMCSSGRARAKCASLHGRIRFSPKEVPRTSPECRESSHFVPLEFTRGVNFVE